MVFFERSLLMERSVLMTNSFCYFSPRFFFRSWIVFTGAFPCLFSLSISLLYLRSTFNLGLVNFDKSRITIFELTSGNGFMSTPIGLSANFRIPLLISSITYQKTTQSLIERCQECHLQNLFPFNSLAFVILWSLSSRIYFSAYKASKI